MNSLRWIACLAVSALAATAPVGAQQSVLREGDVTRQGIIDQLAPGGVASVAPAAAEPAEPAQPADSSGMRSRGFHPRQRAPLAAAPSQPARTSIMITFVTDSAELAPSAKKALDILADAMKSERLHALRFTVEGHADPRGSDEYNMKLSQERAESVRAYLVGVHGLAAERIQAVGKGAADPLVPDDPAAPENRRVTIVAGP